MAFTFAPQRTHLLFRLRLALLSGASAPQQKRTDQKRTHCPLSDNFKNGYEIDI
jgi:hypothetical protein